MKKNKLSPKEQAFCRKFVELRNGTKAAVAAGYAPKSAKVTASRLLTKANIQAEIKRLEGRLEDRVLMKAEEVEQSLDALIRFNLKDYVHDDGTPKAIHELTEEQASCVRELGVTGKQLTLKFFDTIQAIRLKMQRLGMLKETVQHGGGVVLLHTNVEPEADADFLQWIKDAQSMPRPVNVEDPTSLPSVAPALPAPAEKNPFDE